MAVQFLIGRAGSGKSRVCFERIVEMMRADPLGPPIYLIVPKQETFSAERALTCGSGLEGFCRTRVVSFELLGEQVLAECGGTAIPEVTELGRQMMLGHLLRRYEKELKYYGSSARRIGLAAALDGTFAELERSGRGAVELGNVLSDLKHEADDPSLVQKLADLRLLYEKYIAYLGSERLDPHRRLEQVIAGLEKCRQIRGATVFVDGFLELFDWQRKMLVGLARVCPEVQITVLMGPDSRLLKDPHHLPGELELFHKTELTYRQLWFAFNEAGIAPEPVRVLNQIERFENPSLKQLEQHFGAPRPVVCRHVEGIELIEAPDRRGEADAAARQVLKYVGQGMRLRDIAVLVRDLGEYHDLLDAGFREHGIAHFADQRRTAAHHPLLQLARAALQIAHADWPRDAVMTLLKSELAGISRDEVDELENYVLEHRIDGGAIWMASEPWGFVRKITRRNRDEEPTLEDLARAARFDSMRRRVSTRLTDLVALFKARQPLTARTIAVELFRTFERFDVRRTLTTWIDQATTAGRLEERDEHQRVWTELCSLLDQMVDVIGDEPLGPDDFVSILETGLEQFDLALTPPTVDQVLIGAVDRTRSIRPRAVILLGMNDNQFPKLGSEDSILADSERHILRKHRLDINPGGERDLFDERLLGYIALTRASEQLCLIRAIADQENRPQAPSPFWVNLRQQFPNLVPSQIPRHSESLEMVGTPRQLVTAVMHWIRSPHHAAAEQAQRSAAADPWPSIYHWLATEAGSKNSIQPTLHRAWPALTYQNEPTLSKPIVSKLFRSPLRASVSQIESFASCAFKHFAQYGLRLTPRDEEEVTAIDLGIICHGILERIVRQMFTEHPDWSAHSAAAQEEVIRTTAEQVGRDIRGELLMTGGHNQYILNHIRRTMSQVIDSQVAAGQRGRFVPWRMELEFGEKTKLGPLVLPTPNGNELRLKGKIDRVDKTRDDFNFAVIDYKYSGDRLALHKVIHGLSLQLLTYLLVLQENGSKLTNRKFTPVAALYVQLLRKLETVAHPEEVEVPVGIEGHKRCKPRGLIDLSRARFLDVQHDPDSKSPGELYGKTDGCTPEQFAAMLRLARQKLAELGDLILGGAIEVEPYRIGNESPCTWCEFRSVCRFDPTINRYRRLPLISRADVLQRAMEGKS